MRIIDITDLEPKLDRATIRSILINKFLKEKPGTGKGELTSRYKYITKIFKDGKQVYLSRPANFNNGFDFTINVSDTNFNYKIPHKKATTRPTHNNILLDLKQKKKEKPRLFKKLIAEIEIIYQCKRRQNLKFSFTKGHPTELILECIKWLFVEQDVTYWNYSGRTMFYNEIMKIK